MPTECFVGIFGTCNNQKNEYKQVRFQKILSFRNANLSNFQIEAPIPNIHPWKSAPTSF